ncbi:hypothetical protein BASA81_016915 [Batrachochytrium salamandrivorans]|nr:hypothetical protein BASA81_016915 [Batrachochytrium salamandrivorans]
MRVGTGIILSVLSSSVLAAAIPNYGDHVSLLVRRTGSLANKDVSWSKSDGEQVKFVPSNSGAGASTESGTSIGESNPNSSSINSGLSKMGRFREFIEKLSMPFRKNQDPRKQQYILNSDKKIIQNAAKKLYQVTEGVSERQFVVEVGKFLRTSLESARPNFELYDSKVKTPFLLSISEGKNQRLSHKEMVKIQNTAKKVAKKHLVDVTSAINGITKHPQNVMAELDKITGSISLMFGTLKNLYDREYTALASKVGRTGNEENIKVAENYMSHMKGHQDSALETVRIIKGEITKGRVTFKGKTQSRFGAFKSGVKKRLGLKGKSSTDVTPNSEESGQQISGERPSDENTSNQEESKQGPSDGDTSGQGESSQGPPGQGPSNQAGARPIPAPRKSEFNRQDLVV